MTPENRARALLQGYASAGQVSYADALQVTTNLIAAADAQRERLADADRLERDLAKAEQTIERVRAKHGNCECLKGVRR